MEFYNTLFPDSDVSDLLDIFNTDSTDLNTDAEDISEDVNEVLNTGTTGGANT